MNQCVPGWDVDDNNSAPSSKIKFLNHSPDVPSLEYEVAELTWENGQVAMHGLGVPRVINKATASPSSPATWDKPRAGGTLESIVNQATCHLPPMPNTKELVPWIDHHRATAMTMDALVPCNNNNNFRTPLELDSGVSRCSTRVGSCRTNGTVSNSGRGSSCQMTINDSSWERELMGGPGFTSTYTTSGQDYTKTGTSADDRDSVSHHTRSHGKADDEGKRRDIGKSSVSTKRSRAAAIHNQSERKRRDKINQRMKTLQKLVPSSSKSDKASMLDEVIEYLKQLQAQVHVMSRMNMPSMMLMQQQLQMSMMGMGMGMGVAADHCLAPAASLLMPDPLAALLACQSQVQPMTMDAYTRLAAMYQQLQQQPQPAPSNN